MMIKLFCSRRLAVILLTCIVLMWSAHAATAAETAIVGGVLVNSNGDEPIENSVILIKDGRIAKTGKAGDITIPSSAKVINAQGKWIIPGLIDGHVHFFQSGGLYTRPDIFNLTTHVSYGDELAYIKKNLPTTFAAYLRSGVTSVVDVGGPFWNFDVRAKANRMELAPRVAVAGPLVSTYQPQALTTDDPPILKVNNAAEARALVRRMITRKPDLVKIWYIARKNLPAEQNFPIVKAAVEESHKHGVRVAVHATQLETARLSVKAGADILVHSVDDKPVDREFIKLLKDKNVIYTPNLVVLEGYIEALTDAVKLSNIEIALSDPAVALTLFHMRKQSMKEVTPFGEDFSKPWSVRLKTAEGNLKTLYDAGVVLAVGTDAGNIGTLHGPAIFRELEMMAGAGIPARDVLIAGTANSARIMGREDVGTISAGNMADLVILNANPLEDIRNTGDIYKVIKGGKVFSPEDIVNNTPREVVDRLLVAYNSRNLDAFMATIAHGIKVYTFPNQMTISSFDHMKKMYGPYFGKTKDLHVNIEKRITIGDYVLDLEQTSTGTHSVAIYHIHKGKRKIDGLWYIYGEKTKEAETVSIPGSGNRKTPEGIVREQVEAYNSRDIEAFMATYADDIKAYTHPDKLLFESTGSFRPRYTQLFAETKNLDARIQQRITIGSYVIDKEKVTFGEQTISAVAIYHVDKKKGKIDTVWFIR
ncbi:MAG: amidohydrolase family protein [bacterium]|nr:amidohydrolase family protein [bacterium]